MTLAVSLKKYYVRKGNKIIFSNGMSLNKLALTMWELLGYKEIDASVISRVLKGERIFTANQLNAFCKILNITLSEEEYLKASIWQNFANRAGFGKFTLDNKNISTVFSRLYDDYFESLLLKENVEAEASGYRANVWSRFFSGDFSILLLEIDQFRKYILKHDLHKIRKGRIWLVTISSLRANCLSHGFNPDDLIADPYCVKRDFESWEEYLRDDVPLETRALHFATWGTFLRVVAEYLYFLDKNNIYYRRESERLLKLSVRLRQNVLSIFGDDSPIAITFHSELVATLADITAFYPKKADTFVEWEHHHKFALEIASKYHQDVIGWEACAHEFKARWNIFLLTSTRERGMPNKLRKRFIKECFEEVEITDKLISEAKGKADIIDINNTVTKVKLYEYLQEKPPEEIHHKL